MNYDTLKLYISFAGLINEIQSRLDKTLCDMTANASTQDDTALFNRWAAMLFQRLRELDENGAVALRQYVDEKLANGEAEYRALLAVFTANDIKDIFI